MRHAAATAACLQLPLHRPPCEQRCSLRLQLRARPTASIHARRQLRLQPPAAIFTCEWAWSSRRVAGHEEGGRGAGECQKNEDHRQRLQLQLPAAAHVSGHGHSGEWACCEEKGGSQEVERTVVADTAAGFGRPPRTAAAA
eukprot:359047-Chlamydomonas_euryale.AAC.6